LSANPCWARFVHLIGKSVTAVVPSRPTAIPRYRASVPIVTARDGRPTYATRNPLSSPQSTPTTSATRPASGIDMPSWCSIPTRTLLRPTTLATDRSISPVTMTSVIGSAISRMGAESWMRKGNVSGPEKFGTVLLAQSTTSTRTAMIAVSRVRRTRRQSG
jgi:hypothetical protein